MPGLVAGLAWTPVGGEVMYVEATQMRGGKGLTLTGQLGDVMRVGPDRPVLYSNSRRDVEYKRRFFRHP